jgi:uncharacterized protein involved in exopolysaccharide biosynthesis
MPLRPLLFPAAFFLFSENHTMNAIPFELTEPERLLRFLVCHKWRWLAPAAALTIAAGLYAILVPPTWQASQAMIVRNEATASDTEPGRFHGAEELKNVQGTILELAKNRGVLSAALRQAGPPADYRPAVSHEAWPTGRDVDRLLQSVKLVPPKGAEFGAAEVFYLDVADKDPDRAVLLNRALGDQLQLRFQEVRNAKAESMIGELDKAARLARADRQEATARLAGIERQVGSDLAELRSLEEPNAGDSSLRRTVTEISSELRLARAAEQAGRQMLGWLEAAQADPGRLLAAPNRLLESQPALKRLKDALVDAQVHSAALRGGMSEAHPLVAAAQNAEEEIGKHLHTELAIAIRGLRTELHLDTDRTAMLDEQLAQATERLRRLAGLRASYVNLVAESSHRTRLVERAEQNLSEARASAASAKVASLIARIDGPDTGTRPVSASRTLIVLGGLLAGLAVGLGMLLLIPPAVQGAPSLAATVPPAAQAVPPSPAASAQPWSMPAGPAGRGLSLNESLKRLVADGNARRGSRLASGQSASGI